MRYFVLSVLFLMLTLGSCNKNDTDQSDISIGDNDLDFTSLKAYESSSGILLEFEAEQTKIVILLSDNRSDNYYVKDTLKADDFSRSFACIEYQGVDYVATGGVVNVSFNDDLISGSFDLQFGDHFDLLTDSFKVSDIILGAYDSFSQISMVDENGSALSIPDFSDWNLSEDFGLIERVLFGFDESLGVDSVKNRVYAAHPNPFTDVILFGFKSEANPKTKFEIVNENFEILASVEVNAPFAEGFNSIIFNFEELPGVKKNQFYRIYYRIESDGGVVRGHGDVQYVD